MKRAGIICAVVLLMMVVSLWHYELYADHCNTEQPPQEQPPAEEAPAEPSQPSESPSEQPKGPTGPQVIVDESTKDTRIPEIPPFGPKDQNINKDSSVVVPPKSDPMINKNTMDKIRKSSRVVTVDHVGDGTVVVEQSQEDCCARAEAELNRCYTLEANEVYNQCVDSYGSPGGSFGSYLDAYSGGSDAIDIVCTGKRSEFQTQCIEKFYGKCRPPGCKLPQSIKTAIRREIIEFQYGPGSTGGGGAGGKHGYKVQTDNLPH